MARLVPRSRKPRIHHGVIRRVRACLHTVEDAASPPSLPRFSRFSYFSLSLSLSFSSLAPSVSSPLVSARRVIFATISLDATIIPMFLGLYRWIIDRRRYRSRFRKRNRLMFLFISNERRFRVKWRELGCRDLQIVIPVTKLFIKIHLRLRV